MTSALSLHSNQLMVKRSLVIPSSIKMMQDITAIGFWGGRFERTFFEV